MYILYTEISLPIAVNFDNKIVCKVGFGMNILIDNTRLKTWHHAKRFEME